MSDAAAAPAPSAPGTAPTVAALAPPAAKPPAEFPPPVRATIDWLQAAFAEYYGLHPPAMPDRFTRREFGFILWPERPGPPPFVRHRAYTEADRFHASLARSGPHSVYYSTAYYRRPGEMKMADKQWLGAELIFDLDADHLTEVEKAKAEGKEVSVAEQLRQVKDKFRHLVDGFLLGDFGLGEDQVWLSFSGSRGYHAHVVDARFMQLDARARREIVDYVTGKFPTKGKGSDEPDLDHLFGREARSATTFKQHAKVDYLVRFPTPSEPGWPGRLSGQVVAMLQESVIGRERQQARRWLEGLPDIGPKKAEDFLRFMTAEKLHRFLEGEVARDGSLRGRGELTGSAGAGKVVETIFKHASTQFGLPFAKGETDEPVTADTKRLIRLPGSLHGKSGLQAMALTRSQLDGFEPLRDAVAFPMDPVTIVPRFDQEMTLGGERVTVKKGEPVPVPMPHAVFWCSRQAATVVRA